MKKIFANCVASAIPRENKRGRKTGEERLRRPNVNENNGERRFYCHRRLLTNSFFTHWVAEIKWFNAVKLASFPQKSHVQKSHGCKQKSHTL